jgi:hypothetical protein
MTRSELPYSSSLNVVTPVGGVAVVDLEDGDVGHEAVRVGAVPVLFAALEEGALAGRISLTCPRLRWQMPIPSSAHIVCPFGCVCQAMRAPGAKWTLLALTRELPAGAAIVST